MIKRVFLGGGSLLPEAAARRLAEYAAASTPPSLADTLVMLPGRRAVRIVSDKLAAMTGALLAPEMTTPGGFIRRGTPDHAVPKPIEELTAWQRTAENADPKDFPHLFPVGYERGDQAVTLRIARELAALQRELLSGGLSIADAARRGAFPARGGELIRLEERCDKLLSGFGLCSVAELEKKLISDAAPFADIARIVVIAIPDLPLPARRRLEFLAQSREVEIWIASAEGDAMKFDDFGSPKPEYWESQPLDFGEFDHRVFLVNSPDEGARLAAALASRTGAFAPDECAIVAADTGWLPSIAREFGRI
ncbi:MAG: hypothetical protein PHI35_07970, partial [Victivallaceae bacterium]|nr:hypothetical protein [Victivallaceae bacterium]